MVVVMPLVNGERAANMPRFVPLYVRLPARNVFIRGESWQEAAVMDGREQDALNEVDRITLAVEHLRDLLLAATEADLRAVKKQRPAEAPSE
jgi:hypothetical protein